LRRANRRQSRQCLLFQLAAGTSRNHLIVDAGNACLTELFRACAALEELFRLGPESLLLLLPFGANLLNRYGRRVLSGSNDS
jgi:hypothetical protein